MVDFHGPDFGTPKNLRTPSDLKGVQESLHGFLKLKNILEVQHAGDLLTTTLPSL